MTSRRLCAFWFPVRLHGLPRICLYDLSAHFNIYEHCGPLHMHVCFCVCMCVRACVGVYVERERVCASMCVHLSNSTCQPRMRTYGTCLGFFLERYKVLRNQINIKTYGGGTCASHSCAPNIANEHLLTTMGAAEDTGDARTVPSCRKHLHSLIHLAHNEGLAVEHNEGS